MSLIIKIDGILNRITMYRLMVYILSTYAVAGLVLSATHVLSVSFTGLLISLALLLTFGFIANQLFARLYDAIYNFESGIITTLILFCIVPPVDSVQRAVAVSLVAILAMASKYVLAWNSKHIFNPAAVAVCIIGLTGLLHATWWVGTPPMVWLVLLGGMLIVRKVRRFTMVGTFIIAAVLVMVLTAPTGQDIYTIVRNVFLSWPLLFLGTIMLTEPSTMPPTRYYQVLYALLIGVLFSSRLHIGPLHTTPEIALLAGNIFAYNVSQRFTVRLKFKSKRELSPNTYEYTFTPNRKLRYSAGQYMEWTLPPKHIDARGNRRTFTIASCPTEHDVKLGVKFYEPSSTYKQQLRQLQTGEVINGGHIAGDFVLPADSSQKLLFIAGGIGITPFKSMIEYLQSVTQKRDIILFYAVQGNHDAAYKDTLISASKIGIKVCFLIASENPVKGMHGYKGFLDDTILQKEVPDLSERICYVSGPPVMVRSYSKLLRQAGIKRHRVKTDFFSGY